ncbi:MAG: hypothetical protein LBP66_05085 [Lactococcus lactis]|jgi:hypothetical protein|nr:hypothetical protein [Lactococcus lactis]
MIKPIKCPVCGGIAQVRYMENRVYQSTCEEFAPHHQISLTAHSEVEAIEMFNSCSKGFNQPHLTIPKSIADELGGYFKYKNPFEAILRDYSVRSNDVIEELRDYLDFLHSNLELCITYLAGKALGVDLVKVVEG